MALACATKEISGNPLPSQANGSPMRLRTDVPATPLRRRLSWRLRIRIYSSASPVVTRAGARAQRLQARPLRTMDRQCRGAQKHLPSGTPISPRINDHSSLPHARRIFSHAVTRVAQRGRQSPAHRLHFMRRVQARAVQIALLALQVLRPNRPHALSAMLLPLAVLRTVLLGHTKVGLRGSTFFAAPLA